MRLEHDPLSLLHSRRYEVVAAIVRSALIDEALAGGLKEHIATLQARLIRIAERAAERRRLTRDAMAEVDLKAIKAPDFTVSRRPGSPALAVADEAVIPVASWEAREPRLNRLMLIADLKRGDPIPGVALSSAEPALSGRMR